MSKNGRPDDCCNGQPPCGDCFACRVVAYNEKITHRAPLETPGTESYFRAIWGELKRRADKMGQTPSPHSAGNHFRVRAIRAGDGKVFSKACDLCGTTIPAGNKAYACKCHPTNLCAVCHAKHPKHKHWFENDECIPVEVSVI